MKQVKNGGFDLTLHLDCVRREEIEEFSASGFLAVRKNKKQEVAGGGKGEDSEDGGTGTSADIDITLLVPDSPTVLPSLTSDSVQQIAGALGWIVEKRRVPYEELPSFDEVMSAETSTGLVPVKPITRRASAGARPLLTLKMPNDTTTRLHVGPDGAETIVYIQEGQVHSGPLYLQLVAQLGGVQVGKVEDKFGWRCEVLAEVAYVTFKR